MVNTAQKEALRALITKTTALDDATRQKLLEKLPNLNEEQIAQLEKTIIEADAKIAESDQKTQKKISAENERYMQSLKEFRIKTIPQALKIAETEHRTEEEATVENLLQQAARL